MNEDNRQDIKIGSRVMVLQKQEQHLGQLTEGIVGRVKALAVNEERERKRCCFRLKQ